MEVPVNTAFATITDTEQFGFDLINCTSCRLVRDCVAPCPSNEKFNSDFMIIGEAPGKEEDADGEPIVGDCADLLHSTFKALKVNSKKYYITNTVKCRPLDDRTPTIKEALYCSGMWLDKEIETVKPKVIIMLGRVTQVSLFPDILMKHGETTEFDNDGIQYYYMNSLSFWLQNGGGKICGKAGVTCIRKRSQSLEEKRMESLIKYLEIDEIPDEEREHVKVPDTLQVNGMVEEFLKLTRRKKVADKKLKELKPFLLEYLEANATPDAKGTMKLQLPAGKLEGIMRETIRLDDERAIEHCQNQGFDSCFEEVTLLQLKESEFEKKVKDGSITAEELRSLVDVKKSLALYVKELV